MTRTPHLPTKFGNALTRRRRRHLQLEILADGHQRLDRVDARFDLLHVERF